MQTGLRNRIAVVTGGSGAIGQAIAHALANEGARVAVAYKSGIDAAESVVSAINADGGAGTAQAFHHDMANEESSTGLVADVSEAFGPPSIIVANAVRWPSPADDEITGLRASLLSNVVGSLAVVDAALPAMRDAGWGRVVMVSTDIVDQPLPGPLAYATAKGALETAATVLAVREARHGILTNTVRPGFTLTERTRSDPRFGQEMIDQEGGKTPTGRICTPEDVASAVTYLAAEANSHVNGQVLSIAGGRELVR